MKTHVAFLRAINVGGHAVVSMIGWTTVTKIYKLLAQKLTD